MSVKPEQRGGRPARSILAHLPSFPAAVIASIVASCSESKRPARSVFRRLRRSIAAMSGTQPLLSVFFLAAVGEPVLSVDLHGPASHIVYTLGYNVLPGTPSMKDSGFSLLARDISITVYP